jgi:(1->4)-alpha-D-glucan 1-alpha-D-glucosylmutase
MTCPGVPDLYQGTERWDFSLVDPDNRSPVDYTARHEGVAQADEDLAAQLNNWHGGQIKQTLIMRALRFRQRNPALFLEGRYLPIAVEGPASDHILAFARFVKPQGGREDAPDPLVAIVAVTLNAATLSPDARTLNLPPSVWDNTDLVLPRRWSGFAWRDEISMQTQPASPRIHAAAMFKYAPIALLSHDINPQQSIIP